MKLKIVLIAAAVIGMLRFAGAADSVGFPLLVKAAAGGGGAASSWSSFSSQI